MFLQKLQKACCINVNTTILLFIESYFNCYYQRLWEKIKLAKVIINKQIENHIRWEEQVLIVKW